MFLVPAIMRALVTAVTYLLGHSASTQQCNANINSALGPRRQKKKKKNPKKNSKQTNTGKISCCCRCNGECYVNLNGLPGPPVDGGNNCMGYYDNRPTMPDAECGRFAREYRCLPRNLKKLYQVKILQIR